MPVTVSLYELLRVKDSRRAWPGEFDKLVMACEKDVADRLPFGVVADWCEEHGEVELANAFRWLSRRTDVVIDSRTVHTTQQGAVTWFSLAGHPASLREVRGRDGLGLAGVVVALAERLEEVKRDAA